MRNSRIGTDEDWLISPVKDKIGNFFDSRKIKDTSMPQNADANGAYHIALKGQLMIEQLSKNEDTKSFKPDLSNKTWYEFIQHKNKKHSCINTEKNQDIKTRNLKETKVA